MSVCATLRREAEGEEKAYTEFTENTEVAESAAGTGRRGESGKPDPSTARPDAPNDGAEEKVGPLRSG